MPISPDELSLLIDSHWGPLVAWVGSGDEAEDIVQQAFIALAALSEPPKNPRAWLYKAARNKAINSHKSAQRRHARQQHAAKPEQAQVANFSGAENSELRALLARLPQDQREIIAARVWSGFTFDEIAEMQNKSKATVWRLYNTALETLRTVYKATCETNDS